MRRRLSAIVDRRRADRVPMRQVLYVLAAAACVFSVVNVGGVLTATATGPGPDPGKVLRVGTYNGIAGQYTDIQEAVDDAHPGDWVLIGPGDYKVTGNRLAPGAVSVKDDGGNGILITTPAIHVRGMDRNDVMIDGTKPGSPLCSSAEADQDFGPLDSEGNAKGRNGIVVYKASSVSLENFSTCNFLAAPALPGATTARNGNQQFFDGGAGSGFSGLAQSRGAFLSATSSYWAGPEKGSAQYGQYSVNHVGPTVWTQVYGQNMADAAIYIGACAQCQTLVDHSSGTNNGAGYSGTNASAGVTIQYADYFNNRSGVVPNSLNDTDTPSPQTGACFGGLHPTGPTGTNSCWVLWHSKIHDNNNPNTPVVPPLTDVPVGTGFTGVAPEFDTIIDNEIYNNGAWGVVLSDFPDSEIPPPWAHCEGGEQINPEVCYFSSFGNQVLNNKMYNNGFFGNPTNGDLADIAEFHNPGDCFVGNVNPNTGEPATTAPEVLSAGCGLPSRGAPLLNSAVGEQLICAAELFGPCPTSVGTYPRTTQVTMLPPTAQPTMANPCEGVPQNPWCPDNAVRPAVYPVPGLPVTLPGQEGAPPGVVDPGAPSGQEGSGGQPASAPAPTSVSPAPTTSASPAPSTSSTQAPLAPAATSASPAPSTSSTQAPLAPAATSASPAPSTSSTQAPLAPSGSSTNLAPTSSKPPVSSPPKGGSEPPFPTLPRRSY